jgi:hypothetical protein
MADEHDLSPVLCDGGDVLSERADRLALWLDLAKIEGDGPKALGDESRTLVLPEARMTAPAMNEQQDRTSRHSAAMRSRAWSAAT